MHELLNRVRRFSPLASVVSALFILLVLPGTAQASEASLRIPDLQKSLFFGHIGGHTLLVYGMAICAWD